MRLTELHRDRKRNREMRKFKIYYADEYYVKGKDGVKCKTVRSVSTVCADNPEKAEKIFYQNTNKMFAQYMIIGHNVTVENVQEIYEPYFDKETRQNILKDFMKKC